VARHHPDRGGLFLIAKATHEIHTEVEARDEDSNDAHGGAAFFWVIIQIIVIDMVFSLDSIITAIGMAQDLRHHDRRRRHRLSHHVSCRPGRARSWRNIRPPRCWRWHSWC